MAAYLNVFPSVSLKKLLVVRVQSECQIRTCNNVPPVPSPGKCITTLKKLVFSKGTNTIWGGMHSLGPALVQISESFRLISEYVCNIDMAERA